MYSINSAFIFSHKKTIFKEKIMLESRKYLVMAAFTHEVNEISFRLQNTKKNNRGYPTREAEDAQLLSAKKYMQDRIRELKNKSG
jgi:hypothetical protein